MRKRVRPAIFSAISADVPYNKHSWECDIAEANPRTYPSSPWYMTKETPTVPLGLLSTWPPIEDFNGILKV